MARTLSVAAAHRDKSALSSDWVPLHSGDQQSRTFMGPAGDATGIVNMVPSRCGLYRAYIYVGKKRMFSLDYRSSMDAKAAVSKRLFNLVNRADTAR